MAPSFDPLDLAALRDRGDPLADAALAEALAAGIEGSRRLAAALRAPHDPAPPAARNLLDHAMATPWADPERLRRGSDSYLAIGTNWLGIALSSGSLVHTYSDPAIARVLVETGQLTRMAHRRLQETGAWNIATALPLGLLPGRDGFVQNLEVRLLHARVRAALLRKGWPHAAPPINQHDMLRTWLDFTYVPFHALARLGIGFSAAESADLYHLWQVAGHLLGVETAIIGKVNSQQDAETLLALVDAETPPPDENSRALTGAMLDAMGALLAPGFGGSAARGRLFAAATVRRLHGPALADRLGAPANWMAVLFPYVALTNTLRRWRERRNPALRAPAIAAALTAHADRASLFAGPTAYETAAQAGHGTT